jgi:hypothetical protein
MIEDAESDMYDNLARRLGVARRLALAIERTEKA